jgi:hypothetical protein
MMEEASRAGRARGTAATVIHLFRLSKLPPAKTTKMKPALARAAVRIVSAAIPKSSCATIPNRTAAAIAAANDKMGMTTRPMQSTIVADYDMA